MGVRFIITALLLCVSIFNAEAKSYYFSSENKAPFKSLNKVKHLKLRGGDTIYLRRGEIFRGEIFISNFKAEKDKPLVVTSYGDPTENMPIIDAAGSLAGVRIYNSRGVVVQDIAITANGSGGGRDFMARSEKINLSKMGTRCGIYVKNDRKGEFGDITLKGVNIYDVFLNEEGFIRSAKDVHSANGTGGYGFGILFHSNDEGLLLHDVLIEDCRVENVAHTGIRFVGRKTPHTISNVAIYTTDVKRSGGPGIQMSGVDNALLHRCCIDQSGSSDDTRKWGRGTGYWCFASQNIVVEHCTLSNANGPADSSGAHIDYGCNNILYQYNLSRNNAGGFVEILGDNYNCIYRYNVSVNDGHRVNGDKSGKAQEVAHQWGYSIWVSNWSNTKRGPYNTYIYNNTIYVDEKNISRNTFTKTLEGIYIANNIFHVEGDSQAITTAGGGYFNEPPKRGQTIFRNNLFFTKSSWAEESTISDCAPRYGDAQFINQGGETIEDYTPQNRDVVGDGGEFIEQLKDVKYPMLLDLKVDKDILGNLINGRPDFGAIEIK